MTTEGKPRLIAFAGPDHRQVNKRVAAIMAAWEELPPQFSVPLPFCAFQSIMDKLQEGVAAIIVDGGNALDEIQIVQGLFLSIFLKALPKENADAAKAYDMLGNLSSQTE